MSKCSEFMIGDWISPSDRDIPMRATCVDEDYVFADFEGNKGDMWEFDDKKYKPGVIPLTKEILEKNGFKALDDKGIWHCSVDVRCSYSKELGNDIMPHSIDIEGIENGGWFEFGINKCLWAGVSICYVHELQHALRLAGLNDLADNFKVE